MDKCLKASFTVEAALIMPFIILILITMMYFTFFLHDRAVLRSTMHHQLLQEERNEEKAKKELEGKMFLLRLKNLSFSEGLLSECSKVAYECPISLPFAKQMLMDGKKEMTCEVRKQRITPSEIMWDATILQ